MTLARLAAFRAPDARVVLKAKTIALLVSAKSMSVSVISPGEDDRTRI